MPKHIGKKPYKYDVCEYAFTSKSTLTRDNIIYSGEKPSKCDVCEFVCSWKCNLIQHMIIHTG